MCEQGWGVRGEVGEGGRDAGWKEKGEERRWAEEV